MPCIPASRSSCSPSRSASRRKKFSLPPLPGRPHRTSAPTSTRSRCGTISRRGGLLALDRFPEFDALVRGRVPSNLLESFRTPDGHFYQVPWKTNPVMMFYNLRLMHEAGVRTIPRTYSEYFALGDSVNRNLNHGKTIEIWTGERDIRPIWWQRMFDFYPFYLAASEGQTAVHRRYGRIRKSLVCQEVFAFFQRCYARQYYPPDFVLPERRSVYAGRGRSRISPGRGRSRRSGSSHRCFRIRRRAAPRARWKQRTGVHVRRFQEHRHIHHHTTPARGVGVRCRSC